MMYFIMKSYRKYLVEMDGRAVYSSKNYKHARRVAWKLIHRNPFIEVIVQLGWIIVGI